MNNIDHNYYRRLISLAVYEELAEGETQSLRDHLETCAECREEFADLQRIGMLMDDQRSPVSDQMLAEARSRLQRILRAAENLPTGNRNSSFRGVPRPRFGEWYRPVQIAASAAFFLIGIGVGYLVFSGSTPSSQDWLETSFNSLDGTVVRGVSVLESAQKAGQIEVSFEAGKRYTVLGSPDDPRIQKLLTYALLNEQNDASRLRAVDTLSQSARGKLDPETEAALIAVLKMDENPAVRQGAIELLSKGMSSPAVKEAILQALRFDSNARIRIEAITALQNSYSENDPFSPEVVRTLRERSEIDSNGLVRNTAKALLRDAGFNKF